MNAISVLYFDKENKQKDYEFIARDTNGELVIGWIVVEKPWYSPKSAWTYWMYSNKYGSGGFCGGTSDLGLERIEVNPATIKPFNQIEEIKYDLERGFIVELRDEENNVVTRINYVDKIPYELWT
jgi:hypothetical protein